MKTRILRAIIRWCDRQLHDDMVDKIYDDMNRLTAFKAPIDMHHAHQANAYAKHRNWDGTLDAD